MRGLMIALLLLAGAACETKWTGKRLALACRIDQNVRYMPLACSGDSSVVEWIDKGTITLNDGTLCHVRDVEQIAEGEGAFDYVSND